MADTEEVRGASGNSGSTAEPASPRALGKTGGGDPAETQTSVSPGLMTIKSSEVTSSSSFSFLSSSWVSL